MSEALAIVEKDRLGTLESSIERGLATFVEVGNALLEIRDSRLYRGTHTAFDDYCRERWHLSERRANQLITASQTGKNFSQSDTPPAIESHVAALAKLNTPDEQREAWAEVVEQAPKDKKTGKPKIKAKDVQAVVAKRKEKQPEQDAAPPVESVPQPVADALAMRPWFDEQEKAVRSCRLAFAKAVPQQEQPLALAVLSQPRDRIILWLKNIEAYYADARPAFACLRCKGQGCAHCHNKGFVRGGNVKTHLSTAVADGAIEQADADKLAEAA